MAQLCARGTNSTINECKCSKGFPVAAVIRETKPTPHTTGIGTHHKCFTLTISLGMTFTMSSTGKMLPKLGKYLPS